MNILTGNSAAMAGIGSGKVLKSGANDTVFINFDDHGGVGIICFPSQNLFSSDLIKTLQTMHDTNMYDKLVFYLETCESGSMFENILPTDLNIYVTTAANAQESSWGTYCPPDDVVDGKQMNSCLGDLYSVNWMEDVDANGVTESLQTQYETVKTLTTQSHVMQYGTLDFTSSPLSTFFGNAVSSATPVVRGHSSSTVSSRDIPMHLKYYEYLRADDRDFEAKLKLAENLQAEIDHRITMDTSFMKLAQRIGGNDADVLFHNYPPSISCGECCEEIYEHYETQCGRFSDYSLKYTRVLMNVCHYVQMRANSPNPKQLAMDAVTEMCA
jgi:legumain